MESHADYRASGQTLGRKLAEAGADAHRLLEWLRAQREGLAQGEQGRLLARVFDEQFELSLGSAVPQPKSKEPVAPVWEAQMPPEATGPVPAQPPNPEPQSAATMPPPAPLASTAKERPLAQSSSQPAPGQKPAGSVRGAGAVVEPNSHISQRGNAATKFF